jgi:hypothetical protein
MGLDKEKGTENLQNQGENHKIIQRQNPPCFLRFRTEANDRAIVALLTEFLCIHSFSSNLSLIHYDHQFIYSYSFHSFILYE